MASRIELPRIGVDLGGSKIEAVLLDEAGTTIDRRRAATPRDDYGKTLRAIRDLVLELAIRVNDRATVGIGTPGAISPATGLIKNANSVWLNGKPFARDLEQLLERPLRFANDADCFALSEATDGAGTGGGTVFGVILGTGVGGGIVVNGHLVSGPNAIAGEWGHNPLPWPMDGEWPGQPCYCGRAGCVETFLSGPGLAMDHERATGARLTSEEIVRRADGGDPESDATLSRYEHRLARALAGVINLLDPRVVVLGGGLSNVRRLYEAVPLLWGPFVFSDRIDTCLVPPAHGDASGVRGAARLWDRPPAPD